MESSRLLGAFLTSETLQSGDFVRADQVGSCLQAPEGWPEAASGRDRS